MHVKENQKISLQKGRYKEWLTLHPVLAGNVIHNYLYMLETTTINCHCCFKFWGCALL